MDNKKNMLLKIDIVFNENIGDLVFCCDKGYYDECIKIIEFFKKERGII